MFTITAHLEPIYNSPNMFVLLKKVPVRNIYGSRHQETVQEGFVQRRHHPEELPRSLLEAHVPAPPLGHRHPAEASQGSARPFPLLSAQGGKAKARGGEEEKRRGRGKKESRGGKEEDGGEETTGGGGDEKKGRGRGKTKVVG